MTAAGYEHYEISSFCQTGQSCHHNLAYWNGNNYFALGPGAASYLDGVRRVNHRGTMAYLSLLEQGKSPVVTTETLTHEQHAIDLLVFGLRQTSGVSFTKIQQRTGFDLLKAGAQVIEEQQQHELLILDGEHGRLSQKGILLYDSVVNQWVKLAAD